MKNRFERFVEPAETKANRSVELVSLAKQIEEKFLENDKDAPLSKMISRMEAAGLSSEARQEYREAVEAYFRYPSQAEATDKAEGAFMPQAAYFGTFNLFSKHKRIPDLLNKLELKPRLKKETDGFDSVTVNGDKVLELLQEAAPQTEGLSAQEKFLSQINRLKYALHESIHTTQGELWGDQINLIIHELGIDDVVDTQKVNGMLKSLEVGVNQKSIGPIQEIEQNVDLGLKTLRPPENTSRQFNIVQEQEVLLDVMTEHALEPFLKKQTTLMLWCHNELGSLSAALKAWKKNHETGNGSPFDQHGTLKKIKTMIEMIAPTYFAAFRDSSDAETYLKSKATETKPILNKQLTGKIVHSELFSHADLINELNDCELLEKGHANSYRFPLSNKEHLYTDKTVPITAMGIEITALIHQKAAERNLTSKEIYKFFSLIENTVERHYGEKDKMYSACQEEALERFGLTFSKEQIGELFGIKRFLHRTNESNDQQCGIVRDAIVRQLEEKNPDEVNGLVKFMFLKSKNSPEKFAWILDTEKPGTGGGMLGRLPVQKSWDEIRNEHNLSIVSLDVPALTEEEQKELRTRIENQRRSVESAKELLQFMAQLKRDQMKKKGRPFKNLDQ